MSNFDTALKILLLNEGGYNNDPNDKGGETYCGIARRIYPNWPGWTLIDAVKKVRNIRNEELINDAELTAAVRTFYLNQWKIKNLELINNPGVASLVFDTSQQHGNWGRVVYMGVNGIDTANWFDKTIPNALSYDLANKINAQPTSSYNGIAAARKKYVQYLLDSGQLSKTFEKGIMARIKKFIANTWGFVLTPGGTATAILLATTFFF